MNNYSKIIKPTIIHIETPSPFTPLGAKGLGEGNCMSTPVAIANAASDALGIEKAHFVGMSMGGMICQIASARYPSRAFSLTSIMSSSGVLTKGRPSWKASMQMLKRPSGGQSRIDNTVEILQFFR